jgi:uncharacterized protein (DUF488 family)
MSATTIYTIGHSNQPIERFLDLLRHRRITVLADVRSHPYSKWAPQYRKEPLARALRNAGIEYVFLGSALGGRPEAPELYEADGRVSHERVAKTRAFIAGVARLEERARSTPTAFMCAEENPTRCHRRTLVTPALAHRGLEVVHIRGDGRDEADSELDRPADQLTLFEE